MKGFGADGFKFYFVGIWDVTMTELFFINSLEKVFPDEKPASVLEYFSCFKNERYSFQLVINCAAEETDVTIVPPNILKDCLNLYTVGLIPVSEDNKEKCGDNFVLKEGKEGLYPDLLRPAELTLKLKGKGYRSIWFEIEPNGELPAGENKLEFSVELKDGRYTLSLNAKVINASVEKNKLTCTHWFHCDCLADWYNVEVFSEEHWKIVENYIRFAVKHGINMILTPLFTPPLDTEIGKERRTVQLVDVTAKDYKYQFSFDKLDRWIDMCLNAGVQYFEMSHLFTQWGAKCAPKIIADTDSGKKAIFGWNTASDSVEYKTFLKSLSVSLKEFIEKKGIKDRCYFHVSDEPSEDDYLCYKKTSSIISEFFGEYKCIDALSEPLYYEKGITKTPIPVINSIDKFYGKVPELWTYYCCGPTENNYINRFLHYPSVRNRAIGYALYKYGCKGFLHWGYNYWYTALSKQQINPFEDSQAGGAFPAGDGFVVYPGENNNPLPSLRLKVFYEGLQDEAALRLLESLAGREKALAVLEDGFSELSFNNYPSDSAAFLRLREKINSAVDEYCS